MEGAPGAFYIGTKKNPKNFLYVYQPDLNLYRAESAHGEVLWLYYDADDARFVAKGGKELRSSIPRYRTREIGWQPGLHNWEYFEPKTGQWKPWPGVRTSAAEAEASTARPHGPHAGQGVPSAPIRHGRRWGRRLADPEPAPAPPRPYTNDTEEIFVAPAEEMFTAPALCKLWRSCLAQLS